MKNIKSLLLILLACFPSYGQNAVSGFVNFEDPEKWEKLVYLTQFDNEFGEREKKSLATAEISEAGYFEFDKSVFNKEDRMYQVQLRRLPEMGQSNEISNNSFVSFIISREDSLYFPQGEGLFSDYFTSSPSDNEWQKLKKYEATSETRIALGTQQYLQKTRNYTKDSLQILLVKLLSIQTLEDQKLLQKDVRENADYYLDFLSKLQKSELPPASYAYLERRIQETHQELFQRRYYTSLAFNGLLLVVTSGLVFMVFRKRKNNSHPRIALSRQEENVKALILEGKTNKEIAGALFISISTVKTHISNIYSKLEVSNRKDLIHKP